MDALVQTALVGTARQPESDGATGTPVDGLLGAVKGATPERRIVLAAGTRAVYRAAGHLPEVAPAPPAPCPAEPRPYSPPAVARLLRELFGSAQFQVRAEALERVAQTGSVLPNDLLLKALTCREDDMRMALRPVLGERGRWLARQNPQWSWAADDASDALPANAEQVWAEATTEERLDVFRHLRLAEPARAREWLADVWYAEKAEMRCELLELLAVNLSNEDEATLERALADRALSVRSAALPLLARLPESGIARRMLERADALLSVRGDAVKLTLPRRLDERWKADGIQEPAPQRTGKGAWWATQVLSLVPPEHWRARLEREPADVLAMLPDDDAAILVESWSRAALLHEDAAWMPALWDWLRLNAMPPITPDVGKLMPLLFARMPNAEAELRVIREVAEQPELWQSQLPPMLDCLSRPWSEQLTRAYLAALREHVARLTGAYQLWTDPFFSTLELASLAIPMQLASLAIEPFTLPDSGSVAIAQWRDHLRQFAETVALRQRIYKEIPV